MRTVSDYMGRVGRRAAFHFPPERRVRQYVQVPPSNGGGVGVRRAGRRQPGTSLACHRRPRPTPRGLRSASPANAASARGGRRAAPAPETARPRGRASSPAWAGAGTRQAASWRGGALEASRRVPTPRFSTTTRLPRKRDTCRICRSLEATDIFGREQTLRSLLFAAGAASVTVLDRGRSVSPPSACDSRRRRGSRPLERSGRRPGAGPAVHVDGLVERVAPRLGGGSTPGRGAGAVPPSRGPRGRDCRSGAQVRGSVGVREPVVDARGRRGLK